MKIAALEKYRGRNPHGYFEDLPWDERQRANTWLSHFMRRWGGNMTGWRFAILVGQAKRLARMSAQEHSAWGRSMLAKKGGHAVQERYRQEGRVGSDHPAHKAAETSATQRKWRKQQHEDAERRARLGLPPKPRVWHRPLD